MRSRRLLPTLVCAALLTATAACSSVNGSATSEHSGATTMAAEGSTSATPSLALNATLGKVWGPNQEGYGQIKPAKIYNGGAGVLGEVDNVVWSSWGGPEAHAVGTAAWPDPTKIEADLFPEQTQVVAFNLGTCDGQLMYQNLEWYFPQHGESFDPTHYLNMCTGEYVTGTPTTGASTPTSSAAQNSGSWTGGTLTITPTSLGVVKVGMTIEQADAATGLTFENKGDGQRGPELSGQNNSLAVRGDPITCVEASGNSPTGPTVMTQKGITLGDPESKVTAAYPDATPLAAGGPFARPGYLVTLPGGQLAINVEDGIVDRIAGGPDASGTICLG
ncbi:hypothetical protein [Gordonia sp. NPDC003950]